MDQNIFLEKESDNVYFVRLKKEVYEQKAVMTAAQKFSDRCYIRIDELKNNYVGVWFKLRYEINPEKVRKLLYEFCNEVLDRQIQIDLEDRFGNLREIIYQKAFAAAGGVK